MSEYKLVLPKMGESVAEATILSWLKQEGDRIEEEEIVLEVATDKVDTDVPSPVEGILRKILFKEGDVVQVGEVLAIVEVNNEIQTVANDQVEKDKGEDEKEAIEVHQEPVFKAPVKQPVKHRLETANDQRKQQKIHVKQETSKYYTPLVLNIARVEGITFSELEKIEGTGKEGRVTKEDMMVYLKTRVEKPVSKVVSKSKKKKGGKSKKKKQPKYRSAGADEIIEMDRIRKIIAKHMIHSKQTAAHVSSFIEVDVTKIVEWRNLHKEKFFRKRGFKLTFMPFFIQAIAKAIKKYPLINVSVDGDHIIKKKDINIGFATALANGNLIVPIIKYVGQRSLKGIAKEMHKLIKRAHSNQLLPDDTQGGTYTISNIGTFGNILGTPIINQPQVAIMAVGAITKKPVVVQTKKGDKIKIRHMMYLSHTYDHRVVDGALGGMFVKEVAEYLERFEFPKSI